MAPDVQSQERAVVGEAIFTVIQHLEVSHNTEATLARLLKDKRPHVRLTAAVTLAHVSPEHPEVVPAFRRLLRAYRHFFHLAADALCFLGPKAAPLAPDLLPQLEHASDDVQRTSERILRRLGKFPTVKEPSFPAPRFDKLWSDLAGKDAMAADLVVRDLVRAGPKAVAFLAKRLKPPPSPTAKRFKQLLAELDSDDFDTREKASAELARHIETVAPALRKARSDGRSLEVGLRVDKLLAALEWPGPPEHRRRLRCLRVLEEIGGSEARSLLERLAKGSTPGGLPWEEARLALRRVGGR
jgi:hypothetical protein